MIGKYNRTAKAPRRSRDEHPREIKLFKSGYVHCGTGKKHTHKPREDTFSQKALG